MNRYTTVSVQKTVNLLEKLEIYQECKSRNK